MTTEVPDSPLVVAAFLARYFADQEAGALLTRDGYEALFPGYREVIAAEYDRLQQGEASPEAVEGERLAGYRIARELGRGGQGIVYLAHDERLDRHVALKVLPGAFSATVARQRLLREAQAASRLEDPGICTVYDAGEQDGVAYIAMQYVAGESLHARIERERTERPNLADRKRLDELLSTFEAILRSLHGAHEKGLVHRDIKPSNLMLSEAGAPMILDFGLAAFDDHPDGSLTGEVALGTPAYMSPEQLSARQGRVDARSDVFSLAVTMFEAVALVHPFEAPTRERLYQHILEHEAPSLAQLVPGLPRDLDVVLQCALAKDRTRRYASALAFADDLRAVRSGEPIQARQVSTVERAVRWARRNPTVALLAVATVVFVVLTALHNRELGEALRLTRRSRLQTRDALAKERKVRERAEALYYVGLASSKLEDDPELALLLAREARKRLDHHLTRSTLRAALEKWRPQPRLPGIDRAGWARVSPDGARVAVDDGDRVAIFDRPSLQRVATIPCPDAQHAALWWSDDGARVVIAERNDVLALEHSKILDQPRPVRLHRADNGELIAELPGHVGKLTSIDFDDVWVVTGDGPHDERNPRAGTVRIWDMDSGERVLEMSGFGHGVANVIFKGLRIGRSPMGLAVLSRDGLYREVNGLTKRVAVERRVIEPGTMPFPPVFLDSAGKVYVDRGNRVEVFGASGDDKQTWTVSPGARREIADRMLLTRSGSKHLYVVDKEEGERPLPLPGREMVHIGTGVRRLFRGSLFPNTTTTIHETTVQAVFADGSIRIWSIGNRSVEDVPAMGGGAVSASFSEDGKVAAIVGPHGRVRVFEVFGLAAVPTWRGSRIAPWEALHPDGKRIATFRRDGSRSQAVVLDLSNGSEVFATEPRDSGEQARAAWSPDGSLLALGSENGEVQIVRIEDGKILATREATDHEVRQLTFDPSGRYLLVLREHAEVWDARSFERVHVFDDVPAVASAMFAAGGTRVVLAHTTSHQLRSVSDGKPVGTDSSWVLGVPASSIGDSVLLTRLHESYGSRVGGDGENWLLNARTGERVELPGGPHGRGGLSPDGRVVAMPRPDGSIELFDRERRKVVRTLRGHDRKVNRVRFSADGSVFVTGWASLGLADSHDERRVCVWSKDGELLQQLEFERSGVGWLDISRDGKWIAVKTNDGELSRYPVRPLEVVEGLELRDFTAAERERYELR